MMVRWHLVFEQLQQYPELVEEDLQGEVEQLAKTDRSDNEPRVLSALQARLGNFGLQQLLAGHTPPPTSAPAPTSESPVATDTPVETEQPIITTETRDLVKPDVETTAGEVMTQPEPPLADTEAPHSIPKADPKEAEETIRQVEQKPQASDQAVDPLKQSQLLLLRVLSHLPHLSSQWLSQLADWFRVLDARQQTHIVQMLNRRIQMLDNAEQARILETLQNLPKSLQETALLARLIARLLATVAPPPPPAPPAPPEE